MALKKIAVIGGGISGLAVLHFLKKRFKDQALVTLYEQNAHIGGNIQSLANEGFLFETGPNGFMASQPSVLELIEDLGLTSRLIQADHTSYRRYIQVNGVLHRIPADPVAFLKTPLISSRGKWHILKGAWDSKVSKDQSIHDYASRRFGLEAAQNLFDPFVTGIFAGDARRLHMASCFNRKPKMGARLLSFSKGMGELISSLYEHYMAQIQMGVAITNIDQLKADHIISTVPAYAAARIFNTPALERIPYAAVAVVGLGFTADAFKRRPDGFGYLVPSSQHKKIMGVLVESNVFAGRAPEGDVMLRVMMGGRHHPDIANDSPDVLVTKALAELDAVYGLTKKPKVHCVQSWGLAIPQYEMDHQAICASVRQDMGRFPNVTLSGNYLGGISFNDCVNNAKSIADTLTL